MFLLNFFRIWQWQWRNLDWIQQRRKFRYLSFKNNFVNSKKFGRYHSKYRRIGVPTWGSFSRLDKLKLKLDNLINIHVCLMKLCKHEARIVKSDCGCVNLNTQILEYSNNDHWFFIGTYTSYFWVCEFLTNSDSRSSYSLIFVPQYL